jgi:hypothetical protein
MDEWAWEHLQAWTDSRVELPVGPLFCVIDGPTRGRPWSPAAARADLRRTAATAGVRRRFAPHQLRHAHAVEMAHEGVPLIVIQRQLETSMWFPRALVVSGHRRAAAPFVALPSAIAHLRCRDSHDATASGWELLTPRPS